MKLPAFVPVAVISLPYFFTSQRVFAAPQSVGPALAGRFVVVMQRSFSPRWNVRTLIGGPHPTVRPGPDLRPTAMVRAEGAKRAELRRGWEDESPLLGFICRQFVETCFLIFRQLHLGQIPTSNRTDVRVLPRTVFENAQKRVCGSARMEI